MSRARRTSVAVVIGTRPEAVKLAPVLQALEASPALRPVPIATSQHRDLVAPVLRMFGVRVRHELKVMRRGQALWDLSARLMSRLGDCLGRLSPPVKAVLVQGDTSSALCGGLAAYYHQLPVGHVEAGLRTDDRYAPFPEEMNRRLLASLGTWHFCPTELSRQRLLQDGVPAGAIHVTGNTVVDALRWIAPRSRLPVRDPLRSILESGRRVLLVTCHRRESFGPAMVGVAEALAAIARSRPESAVLFPVHPNPAVRKAMVPRLRGIPNVTLCAPLSYDRFLTCLRGAWLVLTDSGGVQEEATALGKPVLVLRDRTERVEGVQAGALKLVGTNPARIRRECDRLWNDPEAYSAMSRASDVFGDGRASRRILAVLSRALAG